MPTLLSYEQARNVDPQDHLLPFNPHLTHYLELQMIEQMMGACKRKHTSEQNKDGRAVHAFIFAFRNSSAQTICCHSIQMYDFAC